MLLPFDPNTRRADTAKDTSLGAIADGLARELAPWRSTGLPIPAGKAKLTRVGGRCPVHGIPLDFDPSSPHAHRCGRCATDYTDREHHDWWVMGAQLFSAERAVHAAALFLLRGDESHRDLAARTLREFADRYDSWPNRDNVLGPTRPFFSTYLESIWLINICHALTLLEAAGEHTLGGVVRDRLIAPSSTLIDSYHEGRSNRQVWNEVAVLSALSVLDKAPQARQRAESDRGLLGIMREGLLDDGTWFEGENYHQFAHRGLWYGVQFMRTHGVELPPALQAKYTAGFVTPFAALLPDETLPSRRDSQYAVSIRQWRWAEWCELGYAESGVRRLAAMLSRLYDGRAPQGDTGRARSTADAERNTPAVALSRADCSWRALLMAGAQPVPGESWQPQSLVQPRQGLAIIRRDSSRVYVALEGGVSGGGHGHPDRLSLTLQTAAQRWLDDPGTGSYVERTLHWYRSTLAHHAPLVNGASQSTGEAELLAFEDRGGAGWISKKAEIAPGVRATRSVVVCDGYLVDLLEWHADEAVTLTLPVATGRVEHASNWRPATIRSAGTLEDGFEFLDLTEAMIEPPQVVTVTAAPSGSHASGAPHSAGGRYAMYATYTAGTDARWWRAVAPGAPGCERSNRIMVDVHGTSGRIVGVWSWTQATGSQQPATQVTVNAAGTPVASVTTSDGTTAWHEPAPHGWHIALLARHSRSSIDLEGVLSSQVESAPEVAARSTPVRTRMPLHVPEHDAAQPLHAQGLQLTLGAEHYVQTEDAWNGDNTPQAQLSLCATANELLVHLEVLTGHRSTVDGHDNPDRMPDNPLDNERADINADGVQCYIGAQGDDLGVWRAAVLAVPISGGRGRGTSLVPEGPVPALSSDGHANGWSMTLRWPRAALPTGPLVFDLIINERPPERERRRGQLVLSGGGGFGYLRGDRHTPRTALALRLPD